MEVKIAPETFVLNPVSPGSNTCYGGAASDPSLNGGGCPLIIFLRTKLTSVQNFGLSVTFSCGTFTLLGMLATSALVLLNFVQAESWDCSRSLWGRCSLPFIIPVPYAHVNNHKTFIWKCGLK